MLELDTIYNEDCLEGMRRMDDASVDCIICDPPYLLENRGGGFWSKNSRPDRSTLRVSEGNQAGLNCRA